MFKVSIKCLKVIAIQRTNSCHHRTHDHKKFLKFTNLKMGINYGLNKVRFTNMVAVDSRIRARSVIKAVRERSGAAQLVGETTVEIEGESKPACVVETVSFFHLG